MYRFKSDFSDHLKADMFCFMKYNNQLPKKI